MGKVHLLSLGCPKNQVDSERLLKLLEERGIHYSTDPGDSDIIMVNTCGFIAEAKKESVEEILKAAEFKSAGGKKLVVFGCLAERFGEELRREVPEIDALWGVAQEDRIVEFCGTIAPGGEADGKFSDTPYAYLKISEGCDRGCTYCVIPDIRGRHRSRRPEEILAEAETLVKTGIKELIVVAQDITAYGREFGADLTGLVADLASLSGDFRIRLLYLFPGSVSEALIRTIASEEKVCKYVDMPLQHSEDRILRLMGRGGGRKFYERLLAEIRSSVPDVAIRTTLITGFPGESEEEFEALADFVRRMEFDRLGVFPYSKEEGTAAARMKGQVPKKTRERRRARLMEIQSAISLRRNQALLGREFRALVDEYDAGVAIARICSQAPEIDGVVLIEDERAKKGAFVNVRIIGAYDYDLKGEIV